MPYYTASYLRERAVERGGLTASAASDVLTKSAEAPAKKYDIFLSHSVRDAQAVLGLKAELEQSGKTVYVDWIADKQLSREHVSAATAAVLRKRMALCESLVYATSRAASFSRWMPWELGYFDGKKGDSQIAIAPIEEGSTTNGFIGQEYLGLYKVMELLRTTKGYMRPFVLQKQAAGWRVENVDSFVTASANFRPYNR